MIRNKLSKSLFAIRAAKNYLNHESLRMLYFAIFHSHLTYANIIWSSADKASINCLFKLQKQAIRLIDNAKYNQHTEPLFKKYGILPLPDLLAFSKLQFMHRFKFNLLPNSFELYWDTNATRDIGDNSIILRNNDDLYVPHARIALVKNLPYNNLPHVWNSFPSPDIKKTQQAILFDSKLKLYFINDLADNVNCSRLFCPTCHMPDN